MVRFTAHGKDGTLIGLGITGVNIQRLTQGEPIFVNGESVNMPGVNICIFYGETLEKLQEMLAPMIGKETKIHIDPILQYTPENVRTTGNTEEKHEIAGTNGTGYS